MRLVAALVRAVGADVRPVDRHAVAPRRQTGILLIMLAALGLTAGCAGLNAPTPIPTPVVVVVTAPPVVITAPPVVVTAPPPSPIVVVVTATPAPQAIGLTPAATAAPVAVAKPGGSPTVAAQAKPSAPATPPTPAPQTLKVGRTNSYRGLLFTVEEVHSDQTIEREKADPGEMLVGLRMKVQNPNGQLVHFASGPLGDLVRLRLADGATVRAEAIDPLYRPSIEPQESLTGWFIFHLDRPALLEPMALSLGGGQETVVTIPFSGPEPVIAVRSFEYLRSLDPIHDLIWSVSGGDLRLDIPKQQANPNQEFIVLRIRATNVSTKEVTAGPNWGVPPEATQYLRVRADNGVLLQVSSAIHELPEYFPPKAEQDSIYAWQLPKGSMSPKLVILEANGSEHEIELGPLPPPQ